MTKENWYHTGSGRYPANGCANTLYLCFHTSYIDAAYKESWAGRLVNVNGSDNPVKNTRSLASFWGGTAEMPWLLRGQNSWNLGTKGGIFVGNTENGTLYPTSAEALTETHLYLTGGNNHWARNVKIGGIDNTSTGHFTITDAWYGDNLAYDETHATKLYLDNILYVENGTLTVTSIVESVALEVNAELEIARKVDTTGRLFVNSAGNAAASVTANSLHIGLGEGATGEAVVGKGGLLAVEKTVTVGGVPPDDATVKEDAAGSASLLVKDAIADLCSNKTGELVVGDTVRRNATAKLVNSVVTNHYQTVVGGYSTDDEAETAYTASLEIDGGTAIFEGDVVIGSGRGAAGDVSKLVIKNGTVATFAASANTLSVGRNGNALLQIDNATLSMPAATIAVFSTAGSAKSDRTARVELGEGATVETKGISHGASSGKGEVLIDGGTLKAAAGGAALVGKFNPKGLDTLADGTFAVKIGAKGATIDTAGFDVKIGEDVASGVESGKDGGVAFTGGGSVEFSYTDGDNAVQPASAGWTGGTKVALGTELKFATLASARALLAGGAKVVTPAEPAEAQTAIISLPADSAETFEKTDLPNVSIVDADGARAKGCYAALSSDAKSIIAKASGAVLMVR